MTPATTLAARWHGRRDVRVERVPLREPGPTDALLEVQWCGICGSDFEEYAAGPVTIPLAAPHPQSRRVAPITLGHEVVARVREPAADGSGPPAGALVVPDVVVGCGSCWWCARHEEGLCPDLTVLGQHDDGGLSEFMVARADTCVRVPDHVDAADAALTEPTAVAVRALRKVPEVAGATVVVVGAGAVGLLTVQVARALGASQVIVAEPDLSRRSLAERVGAHYAVPAASLVSTVRALTGDRGADVVVEAAGVRGTPSLALAAVRSGGTTVLAGIHADPEPLDLLDAVLREVRIVGSAAHIWDEDVRLAVELIARGAVEPGPLVSARIGLHDVVSQGLEALARPERPPVKVLVSPRVEDPEA